MKEKRGFFSPAVKLLLGEEKKQLHFLSQNLAATSCCCYLSTVDLQDVQAKKYNIGTCKNIIKP